MGKADMEGKRDWAQHLFVEQRLSQKDISEKTGVSQRTIGLWKDKYNWEALRKSLLVTKKEQLTMLYNQLDSINKHIKEKQDNIPSSKDADAILKITAAIKNLETDVSVADVFEVGKRFVQHVQQLDYEASKLIVDFYDSFIKNCLKQS